jgi:hypothetical protein
MTDMTGIPAAKCPSSAAAAAATAESIIQLDLTRRQNSTPWGWPVPGLALLQELGSTAGGTTGSTAGSTTGSTSSSHHNESSVPGCRRGAAGSSSTGDCEGLGSCGGTASVELALLRPADVVRLHELPSQVNF